MEQFKAYKLIYNRTIVDWTSFQQSPYLDEKIKGDPILFVETEVLFNVWMIVVFKMSSMLDSTLVGIKNKENPKFCLIGQNFDEWRNYVIFSEYIL